MLGSMSVSYFTSYVLTTEKRVIRSKSLAKRVWMYNYIVLEVLFG